MISRLTYKEGGRVVHTPGSNFWRGRSQITGEHDFQSCKTLDMAWKAKILGASSPAEAKKLGRQCLLRADWEEVKHNEMAAVLVRKAMSEPDFVDWLLATGEQQIIEGNWWHDNQWGRCECDACSATGRSDRALNMLGSLLMELRTAIRSFDA